MILWMMACTLAPYSDYWPDKSAYPEITSLSPSVIDGRAGGQNGRNGGRDGRNGGQYGRNGGRDDRNGGQDGRNGGPDDRNGTHKKPEA